VATQLRRAVSLAAVHPTEATAQLGRNCHMPNALTTPLQAVMHVEHLARQHMAAAGSTSGAGSSTGWDAGVASAMGACYEAGVRAAIAEGGCCASRAAYVGACLGALAGSGPGAHLVGPGLPAAWCARYTAHGDVLAAALKLCDARGVGHASKL
jgi:hypothetical protein